LITEDVEVLQRTEIVNNQSIEAQRVSIYEKITVFYK